MSEPAAGPIRPGGATAYDHDADLRLLPDTPQPGRRLQRFRDLPPHEQLRRKVEDTLRFYGGRYGKLMTASHLCRYLHWPQTRVVEVTEAMHDPVTIANLRGLGILPPDVETWDEAVAGNVQPSREQMDALDAIFGHLDPSEERPLAVLLKEQGVDLIQWNGWLTDPTFGAYVRDRTAAVFGQRAHEVDIALMRKAVSGDVAAMKLILELQGRIKQQGTAVTDVNMILARVVEIIQLHVTDTATVLRVAEALEALSQQATRGQLPASAPVVAGELAGPPIISYEETG